MGGVYSTEVQFVGDDLYNRGNLRDMVHNLITSFASLYTNVVKLITIDMVRLFARFAYLLISAFRSTDNVQRNLSR